ncbi:MAG: methyltransferase domain-containing protein [Bacteroidetes bacterium]|nr:methyltransferase domain-containing protein [Bacteroidota bacterium]
MDASELFDKYAELYAGKYMDVSRYAISLNAFAESLPVNSSVLDLACGPGNISKHLLTQRPDLKLTGTDVSPKMIEIAQRENPDATFYVGDIRQLPTEQKIKGVVAGFVFPYLDKIEIEKLMDSIRNILLPGGSIYISTMVRNPEKTLVQHSKTQPVENLITHYHSKNRIEELLKQNGFEIIYSELLNIPDEEDKKIKDFMVVGVIPR